MAEILTLDQARAGLGWKPHDRAERNTELAAEYIPAVTETVEARCGRMADRREVWRTDDPSPITLPWPAEAVVRYVEVNEERLTDWSVVAGVLTITDHRYTAGDVVKVTASGLPTPAAVIKAAQIILAQLWNADHQGRPVNGTAVRPEGGSVPVGVAIPARAEMLLNPYWHFGGFA
jgi:hypothetical protein